jgi:hypothetical protein
MALSRCHRRRTKTGPREEKDLALVSDVKVLRPFLFVLLTLMTLMFDDRFVCAEGPGLLCRPKNEKAADAPARKKQCSGPLRTLGPQPLTSAPATRVPAAAAAELPIIYVDAVASSGVPDAYVVAQAVE